MRPRDDVGVLARSCLESIPGPIRDLITVLPGLSCIFERERIMANWIEQKGCVMNSCHSLQNPAKRSGGRLVNMTLKLPVL